MSAHIHPLNLLSALNVPDTNKLIYMGGGGGLEKEQDSPSCCLPITPMIEANQALPLCLSLSSCDPLKEHQPSAVNAVLPPDPLHSTPKKKLSFAKSSACYLWQNCIIHKHLGLFVCVCPSVCVFAEMYLVHIFFKFKLTALGKSQHYGKILLMSVNSLKTDVGITARPCWSCSVG